MALVTDQCLQSTHITTHGTIGTGSTLCLRTGAERTCVRLSWVHRDLNEMERVRFLQGRCRPERLMVAQPLPLLHMNHLGRATRVLPVRKNAGIIQTWSDTTRQGTKTNVGSVLISPLIRPL
jgi:hypothetical protein